MWAGEGCCAERQGKAMSGDPRALVLAQRLDSSAAVSQGAWGKDAEAMLATFFAAFRQMHLPL